MFFIFIFLVIACYVFLYHNPIFSTISAFSNLKKEDVSNIADVCEKVKSHYVDEWEKSVKIATENIKIIDREIENNPEKVIKSVLTELNRPANEVKFLKTVDPFIPDVFLPDSWIIRRNFS